MPGDKRKNAKGSYVPVEIREEENEELQEKEMYRARIFKRLWSPGIDSKE
jgi:hypothetical protein